MTNWYNKDVFNEEDIKLMEAAVEKVIESCDKPQDSSDKYSTTVVAIICGFCLIVGFIIGAVS